MLNVYGTLMPYRLLEEIRFWKMQEREHTVVIRTLVPALEPPFVRMLEEWEGVFEKTEMAAVQWTEWAVRTRMPSDPMLQSQLNALLQASRTQSTEFIQQLLVMEQKSVPVRTNPVVKTVFQHIIRESEYFLGVLLTFNPPDPLQAPWTSYPILAPSPLPFSQHRDEHPLPAAEPSPPDGSIVKVNVSGAPNSPDAPSGVPYDAPANAKSISPADAPSDEPSYAAPAVSISSQPTPVRDNISAVEAPQQERASSELNSHISPVASETTWSAVIPDPDPVPIGGHKLPPLPYAYDALEPYIDAATMKLHHDKHHQSYVDGLNKAEIMLAKARESGDFDLVKHWERELAFHGAGHYLHTIFWNVMTPKGGGPATGAVAQEINKSFGSFTRFKKHFSQAAEKVEGGGWAILVWSPRSHRLEILQAEKHQQLSQWDVVPLLPLDVWEHAYYLKYRNERAPYIDAWWHVVNWNHVNERFAAARNLKWKPF